MNFLNTSFLVVICTIAISCESESETREIDLIPVSEYAEADNTENTEAITKKTINKTPTQEDLIKKHKVRSKRTNYEDKSYIIAYYNENGIKTKVAHTSGSETSTLEYSYEYDDSGNILKTETSEGTIIEYTYDQSDRVLTERVRFLDIDDKFEYSYDDQNNTQTTNSLLDKTVTHYDDNGLKIKEILYDGLGTISVTMNYTNNKNGNCIKEEATIDGETTIVIMTYEYNNKGLCTNYSKTNSGVETNETYSYEYY